jgi:hypothetical protein
LEDAAGRAAQIGGWLDGWRLWIVEGGNKKRCWLGAMMGDRNSSDGWVVVLREVSFKYGILGTSLRKAIPGFNPYLCLSRPH